MFSLEHLPNQHQGEKVILLLRRHWIIFFKFIALFIFLVTLLPAVSLGATFIKPDLWEQDFFWPIFTLAGSFYYLFLWLLFFYSFLDYYLDVWIVTNYRILNIEQKGLFNRVISEQQLYRVQDVTSEVKGMWPTFFDYGDVYIQTAAERERFVFEQIPHPAEIRRKILSLAEQSKQFQAVLSNPND